MSIPSSSKKSLHRQISLLLQTPDIKNRFGTLGKALRENHAEKSHYDHCAVMIMKNESKLYKAADYAPLLQTMIQYASLPIRRKIISHFAHLEACGIYQSYYLVFLKRRPREKLLWRVLEINQGRIQYRTRHVVLR